MIYFDSAASYPVLPEVIEELARTFSEVYGNSSATHLLGSQASDVIESVREQLADTIGAYPSEIVFTSGATESNNIALKSTVLENPAFVSKKHIVTATTEHKCILAICSYLETQGFSITYVSPNNMGVITTASIEAAIRPDTALVSIMHVNNELGTINPIGEIGELCFKRKIIFHTDAAQSFGKLNIDVDDLNVDLMSFSAHKIGGPKGIGAVYIRDLRNKNLTPVIHGAGHEEGIRGGTVAAPLIAAFGVAIQHFPNYYSQLKQYNLKQYFINKLNQSKIDFAINGKIDSTLPNICSITLPDTDVGLLIRVTEPKFCLAQGSACSSKEIESSHVLISLGLSRVKADKTLRLSFGHFNSISEIDQFITELLEI